jgi:beta-galactosidase
MRTLALVALVVLAPGLAGAAGVARPFPDGFLWGTAIAGFQSDMGQGAPVDAGTDWWTWVRDPQNVAAHRVSGDLPEVGGPGFWLRYAADARLARHGLRANALRMGIEWSRIFPTSTAGVDASGGFTPAVLAQLDALADQTAVQHYRDVFRALRARGLQPMVTLNHFTLPTWLHDAVGVRDAFAAVNPFTGPVPAGLPASGWLDPAIVPELAKLAAYAGWKFGDQVDLWCTINEPVVILVSGFVNAPGVGGNFPPGVFSFAAVLQAIPQLVAGHAAAYDALHATDTVDADGDGAAAQVGVVQNMVAFDPKDPNSAADQAGAAHADYLFNRLLPRAVVLGLFDANLDGDTDDPGEVRPDLARSDFLGVNYYLRATATGLPVSVTPLVPLFDFLPTLSYQTPQNPSAPPCPSTCTEFGWEIYPQGLRRVLDFAGSLGVPVYVTENGIADGDDDQRAQYLYDHMAVVQQAIADGAADVRGYFEWSLTDNFEWASGFYPKFGAYGVDPASGRRQHRPSARVYRTIARKNGIPASLIKRFE